MASWNMPLDPGCPVVAEAESNQAEDPMWAYADIGEEWWADFKARHVPNCERCQEYGAENIEVI
jgi:hypothetical protein